MYAYGIIFQNQIQVPINNGPMNKTNAVLKPLDDANDGVH